MKRLSDWEARLAAYLGVATEAARAGTVNFCALFAAGAVEAVTGEDPAKQFRGRYAETAARLEDALDGLFPVRPVAFARRGDLAWSGAAVGVVVGSEALFVTNRDLLRLPRRDWSKAWTVGDG
jgi:hypothetical protein